MTSSATKTNWGRWGADDERGTLNLIGPSEVVSAAGMVKRGEIYNLAVDLRPDLAVMGNRPSFVHLMTVDGGDYQADDESAPDAFRVADDYIAMAAQTGTHLDALSHVWRGDEIYNGYSDESIRSTGAARCGVDKASHIVGRGVLLDIAGLLNTDSLEPGQPIGVQELEGACAEQQITINSGDIVLVRTGFLSQALRPVGDPFRQPGLTLEAAQWLGVRDPAAIGADTSVVEVSPAADGMVLPAHVHLIRDLGVHLMELLYLDELATDNVSEFLFVAAPLRIYRGTGSPLTPLAIV